MCQRSNTLTLKLAGMKKETSCRDPNTDASLMVKSTMTQHWFSVWAFSDVTNQRTRFRPDRKKRPLIQSATDLMWRLQRSSWHSHSGRGRLRSDGEHIFPLDWSCRRSPFPASPLWRRRAWRSWWRGSKWDRREGRGGYFTRLSPGCWRAA